MAQKARTHRYTFTGDAPAYLSALGRWVDPGETVASEVELVSGVLMAESAPKDKE